MVCCNLCVTSDGYVEEMKVFSPEELYNQVTEVVKNYNAERHLQDMKEFTRYSLTEHQFAQLIGKVRLYQHLPKQIRIHLEYPILVLMTVSLIQWQKTTMRMTASVKTRRVI